LQPITYNPSELAGAILVGVLSGSGMRRERKSLAFPLAFLLTQIIACEASTAGDVIYWSDSGLGNSIGSVHSFDVATRSQATVIPIPTNVVGVYLPVALAIGPDGNLYVGQTPSSVIQKATPRGAVSSYSLGTGLGVFGLAFDRNGILYAAKEFNSEVDKIYPNGTEVPFVTGLKDVNGGVFDPAGNLYVYANYTSTSSTPHFSVDKIAPDGTVSQFANDELVLWDARGDLYTGGSSGTVTMTTPGGVISTVISGLKYAYPFAVNPAGDLYVFDSGNGELIEVGADGTVTDLATLPNLLDITASVPEPASGVLITMLALAIVGRRRQRFSTTAKTASQSV